MKTKNNKDISTWTEIKDRVYGEKGTARRDNLERDAESFKKGILLKKARESRNMTHEAKQIRTKYFEDKEKLKMKKK